MSVRRHLELAAIELHAAQDKAKVFHYPEDFIYKITVVRKATNRLKVQLKEIHDQLQAKKEAEKKSRKASSDL